MKTVDLTRDMRPWRAGDSVHLPDDLAASLVSNGEAQNLRPFQDEPAPAATAAQPARRGRRPGYMTKGT